MIFIKDDIKKMADLLRSGYTMLNLACPQCSNPIFKDKNKELFCPSCNRKVVMVENEKIEAVANLYDKNTDIHNQISNLNVNVKKIASIINEVIFEKIEWLIQKLKIETQLDLIEKYIKIILLCFEIVEKGRFMGL